MPLALIPTPVPAQHSPQQMGMQAIRKKAGINKLMRLLVSTEAMMAMFHNESKWQCGRTGREIAIKSPHVEPKSVYAITMHIAPGVADRHGETNVTEDSLTQHQIVCITQ